MSFRVPFALFMLDQREDTAAQIVAYPREIAEPFATEITRKSREVIVAQLAIHSTLRR